MGDDSKRHHTIASTNAPEPVRGGIYAALVTSRRSGERRPNAGATAGIASWVCAKGVDGVALLGATGEFLDYEIAERRELVKTVAGAVNCPLVVNCSHTTLLGAIRVGRDAVEHGASALMVMPPPFFHRPPSDVRMFFLRFAEEFAGSVPLLMYNLPQFTDWIQYEIAEEMLASGLYWGIKDSSGEVKYFDKLLALKNLVTFRLFVGNDTLFSHGMRRGADGAISGCACAVPELMVALRAAVLSGDEERVRKLDGELRDFIKWLERFPVPQGIREALAERCMGVGAAANPLGDVNADRLREYRDWLGDWLSGLRTSIGVATLGT